MFNQPSKRRVNCFVSAAIVLTLVWWGGAFAKVLINTIDPVAVVAAGGRHLIITGPIECTEGERAELRVTVTQRTTGVVAEGYAIFKCAGALEQWEVHAVAQGRASFEEGPATAVAIASTSSRGETTDAHQWLVNVTLVGE